MALSTPYNNEERASDEFVYPLADNVLIYMGAIVVLSGGYAEPGQIATGLWAAGRAEFAYPGGVPGIPGDNADNTQVGHAQGAVSVRVRRGTFKYDTDGSIALTNVGSLCFVLDDHTVALTDGSATRSVAGRIVGVDSDGVWVNFKDQAALAS